MSEDLAGHWIDVFRATRFAAVGKRSWGRGVGVGELMHFSFGNRIMSA